MPVQRTHRVPILLLALLVGTLAFPRACDEARVAASALLPGTVAPDAAPRAPLPEEERAAYRVRIDRLQSDLAARPAGDTALRDARFVLRGDARGPELLHARVLHRETSSARRSFVVDAGRDDGVLPGHAVLQNDSLVGIVVTASARAARVLRIDDRAPATSLPASVLPADPSELATCRGQGVARGTGDGRVRVSFLPSDGAREGDLVVTGAGSRLVPEGLLLGVVAGFGDEDRDGAFEAVVRPLRDLDQVASVLVVRTEPPGLRVDAR